jgi:hypothetical protein
MQLESAIVRRVLFGEQMTDRMLCRICAELERFLASARQPDVPSLFLGLSESGKRNRSHQHREKIVKAEQALKRHASRCMTAQNKPQTVATS